MLEVKYNRSTGERELCVYFLPSETMVNQSPEGSVDGFCGRPFVPFCWPSGRSGPDGGMDSPPPEAPTVGRGVDCPLEVPLRDTEEPHTHNVAINSQLESLFFPQFLDDCEREKDKTSPSIHPSIGSRRWRSDVTGYHIAQGATHRPNSRAWRRPPENSFHRPELAARGGPLREVQTKTVSACLE